MGDKSAATWMSSVSTTGPSTGAGRRLVGQTIPSNRGTRKELRKTVRPQECAARDYGPVGQPWTVTDSTTAMQQLQKFGYSRRLGRKGAGRRPPEATVREVRNEGAGAR